MSTKNLLASAAIATAGLTGTALAETPAERMQQFYAVADARPFDAAALTPFFADTFTDHDPQPGHGSDSSGAAVAGLFAHLASASPDSKHHITFIENVGNNKALVRWKFTGTQTGELFGAPVSNQAFDIAGMELWEFDNNGKINGLWHVEELGKLIEQITPAEQ